VPDFLEADSMKDAVKAAFRKAKRGETVLLSPACASFDMFENYEHRGREFKRAVNDLD
jgi:UDP-N-acetylmuramoylalanine--D-glutamate ligase